MSDKPNVQTFGEMLGLKKGEPFHLEVKRDKAFRFAPTTEELAEFRANAHPSNMTDEELLAFWTSVNIGRAELRDEAYRKGLDTVLAELDDVDISREQFLSWLQEHGSQACRDFYKPNT